MHIIFLAWLSLLMAAPFNHFNPKTVQTFEGEISSIQNFSNVTRPRRHKQILMRTISGELVVDLGPEWYLDSQDIMLYPGEKVQVTGSLVKINGNRYVIASSITIGETTYKLREANGRPVWRNGGGFAIISGR